MIHCSYHIKCDRICICTIISVSIAFFSSPHAKPLTSSTGTGQERLLVNTLRLHCDARALVLVINASNDDIAFCTAELAFEKVVVGALIEC